jgi:hypothetical protein
LSPIRRPARSRPSALTFVLADASYLVYLAHIGVLVKWAES